MQTIKQSVYVDFKTVELEEAMKMAPVMDILKVASESKESASVTIDSKVALNALKTLSDFGFRMSDGSYYKEPEQKTETQTESEIISAGTIIHLAVQKLPIDKTPIIEVIRNHIDVEFNEAKQALENEGLILPHNITVNDYRQLESELEAKDVFCNIAGL